MKSTFNSFLCLSLLIIGMNSLVSAQSNTQQYNPPISEQQQPLSYFKVYRGNTHSHTIFTWTHGAHRIKSIAKLTEPTEFHPDFKAPAGTNYRDFNSISMNPEDYTNFQGLASNHYQHAIANGYDFYATTDHSQEPTLQPVSRNNPFWKKTQEMADEYNANPHFVAIPGFEFSRNSIDNGGDGHINVLNSAEYVNADYGQRGPAAPWPEANWNIPQFYQWAKTAKPYDTSGVVVIGFNHPKVGQYDDWANIDAAIVEHISTFELHSGFKTIRWEAYVRALNKGWKVSPIGVYDNHSFNVISNPTKFPPTNVLASELTRAAILTALNKRRTFATWIQGVEIKYAVNGNIMGSTIDKTDKLVFEILLKTRPTFDNEKVKRIQILRNNPDGKDVMDVVAEKTFDGTKDDIVWSPAVDSSDAKFFLVRVFHNSDLNEDGSYKEHGSTVAAPVWIK